MKLKFVKISYKVLLNNPTKKRRICQVGYFFPPPQRKNDCTNATTCRTQRFNRPPLPSTAKMRRRIGTEKINGAVPFGNGQNGGAWHDICMI